MRARASLAGEADGEGDRVNEDGPGESPSSWEEGEWYVLSRRGLWLFRRGSAETPSERGKGIADEGVPRDTWRCGEFRGVEEPE